MKIPFLLIDCPVLLLGESNRFRLTFPFSNADALLLTNGIIIKLIYKLLLFNTNVC